MCNCVYKIISKVLAMRIKPILRRYISFEQFRFIEGGLIHEAIGLAQEGLHTIKQKPNPATFIKLDLSKAYDKVSWIYLKLLLIHLGFSLPMIRWIIGCITIVSFSLLINGVAS